METESRRTPGGELDRRRLILPVLDRVADEVLEQKRYGKLFRRYRGQEIVGDNRSAFADRYFR
jgi:hypothetical protein